MIDIHAHILPGVDDGARTNAEALDMLRMAVDGGVTIQYLTPHIHFGRYPNRKEVLETRFAQFCDLVDKNNINVELRLGAEMRIGPELMLLAKQDAIPTLGERNGKKLFLLEFPRAEVPHGSDNLIAWLIQYGYMPIIVHPERNHAFLKRHEKLEKLTALGCPIQLTASSITGKFGKDCQQFALALLEDRRVLAIASDCHNLKGRKPDLKEARAWLGSHNFPHMNFYPSFAKRRIKCAGS